MVNSKMFEREDQNPFLIFPFLNIVGNLMTEKTLNNTNVQKLLQSNEEFDVVIIEQFVNEALKAFASHFKAHLVVFSTVGTNFWINGLVGNPVLPSQVPEMLLPFPPQMSFLQRVENTLLRFVSISNLYLYFYPKHNKFIEKYFPKSYDIYDALNNVSLVLLNSHVSINHAQPSVPCMVEIGGFHIKAAKALPPDLQRFLDDAKEGVIYFSMGSNLKSKYLPDEKRDAILRSFSKRKEKVLWKWEDDVLPNKPPNVKISKWFPQQDILAHPNVKVFITHGGLLSTTETVYHGVPIIAIPIFGDQKANARGAELGGYGRVLPFQELSEEKLSFLLKEVIDDPKYRQNVKKRSIIMNDRQVKPLENAVYWIEYIVRHNGATHLRVPYLNLPWYQFYLLDVLGFLFFIIFLFLFSAMKIISYLLRRNAVQKVKQN